MSNNYIWHCPTESCKKEGRILLKTDRFYLPDGSLKCQHCKEEYLFLDIMRSNIKNIETFLKGLQRK